MDELEVQAVTSICYLSFLFLISWRSRIGAHDTNIRRFVFEFLFFAIPQLLVVLYPQGIYIIAASLICASIAILVVFPKRSANDTQFGGLDSGRKLFFENIRGFTMFQTYISILAVDFRTVYPSRFMKTITTGTSLMDIGVGYYIASSALGTSALPRNAHFMSFFKKLFYRSSIVFLIGFIRFYSLILLDYPYSVSEYGVHWNFFMSLSSVFFVSSLICYILRSPVHRLLFSAFIMMVYQYFLSFCGLEEYLFSDERGPSLISLNKEGVFSIIGYVFIYLSLQSMRELNFDELFSSSGKKLYELKNRWSKFFQFLFLSVFTWFLYFSLVNFGIIPSRREANLTYGLWIISSYLTHLCSCLILDLVSGRQEFNKTLLFQSINRNPLTTFLFANLLTGVINIYTPIPLEQVSPFMSSIIIFIYTLVVCLLAFVLDVYLNLRLK